jgi:hypothetical protein
MFGAALRRLVGKPGIGVEAPELAAPNTIITDDVSHVADDVSLEPSVATAHHACQLLSTLLASGFESRELVVGDLQQEYRSMCHQLGWKVRPWNPLAAAFRRLTTGDKKIYRWFKFTDGVARRVRVYPIIILAPRKKLSDTDVQRAAAA